MYVSSSAGVAVASGTPAPRQASRLRALTTAVSCALAVSAGIAEALVETALGLVVAIPAVWFYNYLTGRIEYFNVEMDNSSSELVDYFIKKTA